MFFEAVEEVVEKFVVNVLHRRQCYLGTFATFLHVYVYLHALTQLA